MPSTPGSNHPPTPFLGVGGWGGTPHPVASRSDQVWFCLDARVGCHSVSRETETDYN